MKHSSSDFSDSTNLERNIREEETYEDDKNGLDMIKTITVWSNTFPQQLASFVLFQNGTGVVFLNKHLKKLSLSESSTVMLTRDQLAQKALQLLKHYGYLGERRVISTRVNRLKNSSGWMVQFDSPYILTFVKPHLVNEQLSLYDEEEVVKAVSHLAFAMRNSDAKELKVAYIQSELPAMDLP